MNTVSNFALAMLLTAVVIAAPPASSKAVTHEEFGEVLTQYLNENPEVIVQAIEAYQQKLRDKERSAINDMIEQEYDTIVNNPSAGSFGSKDADITVVEFFDYNCSACKFMFKSLDAVRTSDDNVRFVFYEFPIFGESSELLSRIGLAFNALAPEQYYEFHKQMMLSKGRLQPEDAYRIAESLGVSRDALQEELSSSEYNEIIEQNRALGDKLNIRGTPFLMVGKEPVPSALSDEKLKALIAEQRKAK